MVCIGLTYDDWGALTAKAVLKMGVRELDLVQDYTGHFADMVLGVYYAKARMYDAGNRRFMAVDSVRGNVVDPQTMVQYTYCLDNPLRWVDLSGMTPSQFHLESEGGRYPVYQYVKYQLTSEKNAPGTFVNIIDGDSNPSNNPYGGAQGWYTSILAMPEKTATGCGSVAAANILMYYAQQNSWGVGNRLYENSDAVTIEEFSQFMNTIYDNYVHLTIPNMSIPVANPVVISPGVQISPIAGYINLGFGVWFMESLNSGVIEYAREQGIELEAHTLKNTGDKISYIEAIEHIRNGLTIDSPVVLLALINTYANTLGGNMADRHYVTITSMTEKWMLQYGYDANGKRIVIGKTLVDACITISTWGEKKEIVSVKKIWESPDGIIFDPVKNLIGNLVLSYFTLSSFTVTDIYKG